MATTMRLIAKQTLSGNAASVTFSDIPGTYTDLYLAISARSDRATFAIDAIKMEPNAATTNLSSRYLSQYNSTVESGTETFLSLGLVTTAASTSSTFGNTEIYVPNYAGSTNKSFSATGTCENNLAAAGINATAGLWSSTAAITSLVIKPNLGSNFVSGSSFFLYGLTKS